jgi:hypothetical protein
MNATKNSHLNSYTIYSGLWQADEDSDHIQAMSKVPSPTAPEEFIHTNYKSKQAPCSMLNADILGPYNLQVRTLFTTKRQYFK